MGTNAKKQKKVVFTTVLDYSYAFNQQAATSNKAIVNRKYASEI